VAQRRRGREERKGQQANWGGRIGEGGSFLRSQVERSKKKKNIKKLNVLQENRTLSTHQGGSQEGGRRKDAEKGKQPTDLTASPSS